MENKMKCACGGEIENGMCKMCGMKMEGKKYTCESCKGVSSVAGKCCGMDMKEVPQTHTGGNTEIAHNHEEGKVCPICSVKVK